MRRALTILLRIESALAALAYLAVAGLLLGEIVARELLAAHIWGSQKIAVFASIIAGFLGIALATAANGHLRPQFADRWWPEPWRPLVARVGDLLSGLIFLAFAVVAALYVLDTWRNHDRAAVLYVPLWPIQLIIPWALFSCALRHFAFAWDPGLKPVPDTGGNE